ncbi:hypothetical protein Phi48:2_gp05 [Cellulophaga phage phi48:2]|uniref:hypothetical protein n=1 Tax=Cellulophaga phage phi48:2 TaxID=1327968 RepID=UPI000351C446|nr:hypothetical protein Phi48:2_gp05 [Cellulophaga phage phi48:2]AGO47253.1 hypothetical protein Phi48:2_gp05 [Cellulophaga phage phi48:2]
MIFSLEILTILIVLSMINEDLLKFINSNFIIRVTKKGSVSTKLYSSFTYINLVGEKNAFNAFTRAKNSKLDTTTILLRNRFKTEFICK